MKCLVVDDDPLSLMLIERFIKQHKGLTLVTSSTNAIDAANVLQQEDVDLVFLDVEMPEMSGLDLIRSLSKPPQIVLVTSKREYALEAFDVDVTDYLLKPVTYARFLKAVHRAQRILQRTTVAEPEDNYAFVKVDGRLVRIDLTDLQWIEAQGDYVLLHTPAKDYLVNSTMKNMEDTLPAQAFARVHRSYIVRLDQINDIEDMSIVIARKVIPIGASYKESLLKRLKTL